MDKIIVASDSFKGSLTSAQVADSVEKGILSVFPDCEVVKLNVADGGEGTVDALVKTLHGESVQVEVSDPLLRPVQATYGIIRRDGQEEMAVLEMSSASGLPLLSLEERNPWLTSTYGTGEMIMDALRRGCRKFLVGIGGSATNDAGTGMLSALGFRFLDENGKEVAPCGGSLGRIAHIDDSMVPSPVRDSEFIVACDVDTPFCGPSGAAYVFARQKGADEEMIARLDEGMKSFAEVLSKWTGQDFQAVAGTGAAGGLGGGFLTLLDARLEKGVEMVLDALDFDACIEGADLVITGEGKIDSQTMKGKTPQGVLLRAHHKNIPVIAIGGSVDLPASTLVMKDAAAFNAVYTVTPEGMALEEAMKEETASRNVQDTVRRVMKKIKKYNSF